MARKRFYSPSTGGFSTETIHGGAIPADAVRVTEPHYARLMAAQAEGKAIVARDGRPRAIDPADDIEARTERNRRRRNRLLTESDWTQLPDSPLSETARLAWAEYRQALRDLDCSRKLGDAHWPPRPDGDA